MTGPLEIDYGFDVGARPINRIPIKGRPDQYRTFQIAAPHESHFRPATCEEADCERHAYGWRVRIEALTDEQRHAIITSRYAFVQVDVADGETYWQFAAGQRCFQADEHRVPVGRPALFVVRRGDYRASQLLHRFKRPEEWRDDFAEHQDKVADSIGQDSNPRIVRQTQAALAKAQDGEIAAQRALTTER